MLSGLYIKNVLLLLLRPDFEVVEHSWLMKVGQGGQIVLTNQNVRIPERNQDFGNTHEMGTGFPC